MNKVKFINSLVLLLFFYEVQGQVNLDSRVKILSSDNIVLRQKVVDSIVIESFWNTDDLLRFITILNKTDFSEFSKKTLLNYFNRTLNERERNTIEITSRQHIERDAERIKVEAEQKGILFETYYIEKMKKEIDNNIRIESIRAKRMISPLYARILGWLDYHPAIPVIQSVLIDSLKNEEYAKNNRKELEMSIKLAMARMGNEDYEKECLTLYKDIEIDCSNSNFFKPLNDLLYINTWNSINQVIKYSENGKIYSRTHPDAHLGIVLESCSTKNIILLYLFLCIIDYPLNFEYPEDKELFESLPISIPDFSESPYYIKQISLLEQWLNKNAKSYKINKEKFYK